MQRWYRLFGGVLVCSIIYLEIIIGSFLALIYINFYQFTLQQTSSVLSSSSDLEGQAVDKAAAPVLRQSPQLAAALCAHLTRPTRMFIRLSHHALLPRLYAALNDHADAPS